MICSRCSRGGGGHRAGVGVGREQGRADGVDPAVGGLGAEHGDDEQLERVVEVELDAGVGVGLGQHPVDLAGPSDQAGAGLGPARDGWHADSLRWRTDLAGRVATERWV